MGIELKTLIEDTCRQFERNFSAGDLARLVSECDRPQLDEFYDLLSKGFCRS